MIRGKVLTWAHDAHLQSTLPLPWFAEHLLRNGAQALALARRSAAGFLPIPEGWLEKMTQMRYLGIFKEDAEDEEVAEGAEVAAGAVLFRRARGGQIE